MAVRTFRTGDSPCLHELRSFDCAPDPQQALSLLTQLAADQRRLAVPAVDRPLALYGAGNLGRLAREFLAVVNQEPVLIVDRNAQKMAKDSNWSGLRLVRPDEVTERDKCENCLAVSVATSPYVPLERWLSEIGFEYIVPFYDWAENFRHLHPLSNGWFASPLTAEDLLNTANVLTSWDDDLSRAHHLQFLAWRGFREEWTFSPAPVLDSRRFFIPEVTRVLHDHEFFLDAGAHHGSVISAFARQTGEAFQHVIAVEPDPYNRTALVKNLRSTLFDDRRITILDFALAEHEGEALFHAGLDYASQLSATGTMQTKIRPIDGLGLAPTFVKLHLEGAELAALKGARHTLQSKRPIVTATIYHNADGIWRTPLWLMETLPDYRFLFRLHSWCGTGAVIYAIPNDRIIMRNRI
jgi:FkbM family methyltransferase